MRRQHPGLARGKDDSRRQHGPARSIVQNTYQVDPRNTGALEKR
jgi:hypothetical protein